MNLLQALFQRAGLPTDIGRLEREKAEKIAAFQEDQEAQGIDDLAMASHAGPAALNTEELERVLQSACKHEHIVRDGEDRLICDKCGECFEECTGDPDVEELDPMDEAVQRGKATMLGWNG